MNTKPICREMLLFFIMISAARWATLRTPLFQLFQRNYKLHTTQRAFIEFPRELPGLLCALVIASLSMLGDAKISLIAQISACAGLMAMGFFTPSFGVMLIFLFVNSMGMHLFMPLSDSMGMALAEPGQVGRRVGQYASVKMLFGFIAGITVFFGFRFGAFSFQSQSSCRSSSAPGFFVVAAVAAALW
jgi:hypothetical protein